MTGQNETNEIPPIKPHGSIARIRHWDFAVVFAYALFKQVDNVGQLEDAALLRFEMVFAAACLALLVVRYVFMQKTRPSALPEETAKWKKQAARLGHLAMYLSLSMIALSGLLIGTLFGIGLSNGPMMDAAIGLHEVSVLASYITIGVHVLAAIYHRILGDGIWTTMVPLLTEKQR